MQHMVQMSLFLHTYMTVEEKKIVFQCSMLFVSLCECALCIKDERFELVRLKQMLIYKASQGSYSPQPHLHNKLYFYSTTQKKKPPQDTKIVFLIQAFSFTVNSSLASVASKTK